MQRVVIDTNVLVSALIQRSYPYLIVYDLFISEKIDLCISSQVLDEYFDVLNRKKFSQYKDFKKGAENLIKDIEAKSLRFIPKKKITLITDKNDNKFLELADECKADFLITGNTNDFTMKKYKRTRIVNPAEYWEKHKPE